MLTCLSMNSLAQVLSKEQKRYEIDAKRIGLNFSDREALPRGREFKRIDSTYYVGWMYEGAYLSERAADALGYQIAGNSLQKALDLLEADFQTKLTTRTKDVMTYIDVAPIHRDWDFIQYALYQCYANSQQTEKSWQMLRRATQVDLQDEFMTETYNLMAWTVHRNRLLTQKQLPFLKNSIAENEAYADALLDSSYAKIVRDQNLMQSFLAINYLKERQTGIWHYKAMLNGYQLKIKAADSFYNLLQSTSVFPENNYATFNLIQGNFDEAKAYYTIAKDNESSDKRLRESYYYSSILNSYSNTLNDGIKEIKELIKVNGSTPGFGWYHLALARLYLNRGALRLAHESLDKAAHFHEVHIGTTLGEIHYQLTHSTLQLMYWNQLLHWQHFADKYWFLKPQKMIQSLRWYWKRYLEKRRWIELVKNNPERQQVLYHLFSTESTIGFSEFLSGIANTSPGFFEDQFKRLAQYDSLRPNLTPYWQLAIAQQYMQQKAWQPANHTLLELIDTLQKKAVSPYNRMLVGLIYANQITCFNEMHVPVISSYYNTLFTVYPQLIPTYNLEFPMRISYQESPNIKPLIDAIEASRCRITNDTEAPLLVLQSARNGKQTVVNGEWFLPEQKEAFRTCTWILQGEKLCDETVFRELFKQE